MVVFEDGKPKKNDPPIPADWAPISGAGKRVRKEPEEERRFLDPIKFRYTEETVAEETAPEAPAEEKPREGGKNRHRRNRHKKPAQNQNQAATPQMSKQEAPAEGEKQKKPNNRHRRNRHHRAKKAQE